jgi:hypothetical protein
MPRWEVEFTDEFEEWWDGLTEAQQDAVYERVELRRRDGPNLRRPYVGEIISSRFPNMKELRCRADGELRVLFLFDPRRTAILLLGGDKTGDWEKWYETAIPQADAIYEGYLEELDANGLL